MSHMLTPKIADKNVCGHGDVPRVRRMFGGESISGGVILVQCACLACLYVSLVTFALLVYPSLPPCQCACCVYLSANLCPVCLSRSRPGGQADVQCVRWGGCLSLFDNRFLSICPYVHLSVFLSACLYPSGLWLLDPESSVAEWGLRIQRQRRIPVWSKRA